MVKKPKIFIKNVYLTEEDNDFKIKSVKGEKLPFENLSNKIRDMIKLQKPLKIEIKTYSTRKPPQRKPVYKFKCTKCGKEIKTNEENLNLKCINCDEILIEIDNNKK